MMELRAGRPGKTGKIALWAAALAVVALFVLALARPALAAEPEPAAPRTATLVIHVEGVVARGGILRLGLYDEIAYPNDKSQPAASADVKAVAGETVIVLHDVTPGTYAIEAYQDVNSNGKMDTTWLGLPLEPFGFSRNVEPHLSKPDFDAVKFTVTPGPNTQSLTLQTGVHVIALD